MMRFNIKKMKVTYPVGTIRSVYQVFATVGCDRMRAKAIAARLGESYAVICKDLLRKKVPSA